MTDEKDLAIAALQAEKQALQKEIRTRAMARVPELLDALNALIESKDVPAAKDLLRRFIRTLDGARDAASSLDVVRDKKPD